MAQTTYLARKDEDADFAALTCDSLEVNTVTIDAGAITMADGEKLTIGTGSDVTVEWDSTNLIVAAAADDSLIEIGDSAATQKSFDVKLYGEAANGADYLYFDASANLLYTTDVDVQFKDNDYLVFGSGSGATGDVNIHWDTTNLIVAAVADDTVIEIGDSAETQLSFDLKWYGGTASGASYLYADASANLLYTTGVDLQFKDDDYLVFGSGSDGTGDVNVHWDTTNLIVAATADDTLIEIGDSAATQLSFDVKIYGDAANGADYLLWDASASRLKFAGAMVGSNTEASTTLDFANWIPIEVDIGGTTHYIVAAQTVGATA